MRQRAVDSLYASYKHLARPSQAFRRIITRRHVHITATPASSEPQQSLDAKDGSSTSTSSADARFEVLGSTFSLLSASISASQNLYTRKGTLLGFNGKPENATSTLSLLEPFRRALFGIPFIYQRTTSPTPYTALIGTKSSTASMVIVHLDGRLDWMVARRNAILAWTGHTLRLSPRLNLKMSLAHWGNSIVSGRGLLALTGKGIIHQISLKAGDEYVVHPSNVIAYNIMQNAPQPYRFKTSNLRLQIPNPLTWLPDSKFWRTMRETAAWRYTRNAAFVLKTWARRTIWGDRLFLHFHGPVTILVQSRATALTDVLTTRDVNEIADSPAGSVAMATAPERHSEVPNDTPPTSSAQPTSMSFASVDRKGSVKFEESR